MRLTTMTQVTVDGVMQANGHASEEERAAGFERGGWAMGRFADDTTALITETYQRADAFLFGRKTYEMFADTWGKIEEMRADPIGVALNDKPKYVASTTLTATHTTGRSPTSTPTPKRNPWSSSGPARRC